MTADNGFGKSQQLRLIDFGNPLGNVSAPAGANWRTLLGQD